MSETKLDQVIQVLKRINVSQREWPTTEVAAIDLVNTVCEGDHEDDWSKALDFLESSYKAFMGYAVEEAIENARYYS